jgi:hypothetical protein
MSGAKQRPICEFSVESYGRLGQPALKLLHALGDEAAGPGRVDWASLAGALRNLCVGLCRGIFFAVHVWECLQSPVGRGPRLACECPQMSIDCFKVPVCDILLAYACHIHIESLVPLRMHLLGAAECAVASCVFVNTPYEVRGRAWLSRFARTLWTPQHKLSLHPTQPQSRRNLLIQLSW